MGLYGIFGTHTQESYPLYNAESRRYLLGAAPTMGADAEKYNVKMLNMYHSALEHTFLWVAEAENPHIIEELIARAGGRFNTIKLVSLMTFQTLRKIKEGGRRFILSRNR